MIGGGWPLAIGDLLHSLVEEFLDGFGAPGFGGFPVRGENQEVLDSLLDFAWGGGFVGDQDFVVGADAGGEGEDFRDRGVMGSLAGDEKDGLGVDVAYDGFGVELAETVADGDFEGDAVQRGQPAGGERGALAGV